MTLSCYFRHLDEIFAEAGIVLTEENRPVVDRIIHMLVAVDYKDCSATWAKVKEKINSSPEERTRFVQGLKKAYSAMHS
jgi:hypothetical protein